MRVLPFSFSVWVARVGVGVAAALLAACGGNGGNIGNVGMPLGRPQALVVGSASGTAFQAISSEYQIVPGSGGEDPKPFSMIVFDGNSVPASSLQKNPGVHNFLAAGKPVVVLNDTEPDLSALFAGSVWAHAKTSTQVSPASAFLVAKDASGNPSRLVEVDFPVHLASWGPNEQPLLPLVPTTAQLLADSQSWLSQVQQKVTSAGDVKPANTNQGQTVLSFDEILPFTTNVPSVLNGQPPAPSTLWGPSNTTPPNFVTQITGTFETMVYVMLEGNSSSTYQHKIFARQYLLVSPPSPLPTFHLVEYPTYGSNDAWTYGVDVYALLGWNDEFVLNDSLKVPAGNAAIALNEAQPQAQNSVVTLQTSQSHTESVGLSATAGIQNQNPLGTITASWSNSWTWGQAESVSFQNWEAQLNTTNSASSVGATYTFQAFAGTQINDATLRANLIDLPLNNDQLNGCNSTLPTYPPKPQLNQLQTSSMANQSETAWSTSTGTLIPPQIVTLNSTAQIISGQIMHLFGSNGPELPCFDINKQWSSYTTQTLSLPIEMNFNSPGLQPADWSSAQQTQVPPPWSLTFAAPQNVGTTYTYKGTLKLNAARSTNTTIGVTYVVQPKESLLTLPSSGICPGNASAFAPGPGVVSAPKQIVIPPDRTQASFTASFTVVGQPYNVQVVSWQPQGVFNGNTVINPQSAYCITVPG